MRPITKILVLLAGLSLAATAAHAKRPDSPGGPPTCDPAAVDAAVAAIAAACPCAGQTDADGNVVPWKNHGKYVRCVAHATKAAVADSDGALRRRCLKSSVRCAARSTCGRAEGVVNCTVTTSASCIDGACDDSGDECETDADCASSSCSFQPSADECTAAGGEPGLGSCCAPSAIESPEGDPE
jgi:hypothetical protein